MTNDLISLYQSQIENGDLNADPIQERTVAVLEAKRSELAAFDPRHGRGWKKWLPFGRDAAAPRGIYIYGGVGRGKSALMDMFFESALVVGDRKRRVHFHAFMLEVHDRLHAWRNDPLMAEKSDPLPALAIEIARESLLICFDEFQVSNIADAMILSRLFAAILDQGVVVVATSNRAPDALYENGLQRELFLPFIALLKDQFETVHMDGETDYRLMRLRDMDVYFSPLDEGSNGKLDEAFCNLVEDDDGEMPEGEGVTLAAQGREIAVPMAARGTARFSFEDLCARPLGAGDYLAIAQEFHTVIISDIPLMGPETRDRAARFVVLIDALYEHRVKLICSAAGAPVALYPAGDGSFEFQRTASRLIEMQTKEYKALEHIHSTA